MFTLVLGALVSLTCLSLLPQAREAGDPDADRDRPERVSIARLLAQLTPVERHPRGMFLPRTRGTLQWQPLGPRPITNEYWSGGANASGRVSAVAVDPTDANTAYAAAAGGGVWKTTDGGQSWTPLTDQLSSLASGALALDPSAPSTILYGTGEQHYSADSLYGDGLFRSFDGGASWAKIGLKADVGNYIARVGLSPGTLHVCSDRGYVRSVNDGATWTAFTPGGVAWCNDLVRSAQAPLVLFAGFYGSGVYKSIDDGASWSQLGGGLPTTGFQRVNLAIADSNASVVYASFIAASGSLAGMYKTTNGGATWTRLTATPNYVCTQGWYDNGMAVSPSNPDVVYAGGVFSYCSGGIARTTNGGTSWTYVTVGTNGSQVHPDQHYFTFGPDGTLWVGADGGVWKTATAGASWVNLNQGLDTALFYTVGVHTTDGNFLVAGTQDNGSVQYQGAQAWPQVIGGDGGPVAVEWSNPSRYFTTYVRMSPLYRWLRPLASQGTVTGPWSSDRASWANGPLVVDPNLATTLLAGTHRVWQTTNSGTNWTAISGDLTAGGFLRALAIAPLDSNVIYSGSSDGFVYATFNRGATWLPRSTGLPAFQTISDIVASPTDPQTAYLSVDRSSGGRLYRTTDGGQTWIDTTGSLPAGVRAMSLAIDFASAAWFVGTDYGIYASRDGGETWVPESVNLPSVAVYDVQIDSANGLVVAATHGRGMWRAALSGGMTLTPPPLTPASREPADGRRSRMPRQPIP
ncbi:MAG: WD40/YVTN/BNR-like repeat-containing protein [Vicinamibacterales bacterium]